MQLAGGGVSPDRAHDAAKQVQIHSESREEDSSRLSEFSPAEGSCRAAGKNFIGCRSIEELVAALAKPRKIFMMVKAGTAVDALIAQLLPLLEEGDILIDGGNSHYPDTVRRTEAVESRGMLYVGCGVSGGEEGALKGPSLMPGGSPAAWEQSAPSSSPSAPRWRTAPPAATGWVKTARATS